MFALVDCNNFYASCERVFNPNLNGKPIVVLSNNDGCVIARSNEAKLLGIPMGAVAFQLKEVIEKHHVKVFSSNYTLYGDMSNRVMTELGKFTPEIEIYSIDEAFLDMVGFERYHDLNEYGQNIKKIVTRNTGIPISIGIAPTKALAKVANKTAKKNPTSQGVLVLDSPEKIQAVLATFPIEDVWGIGGRYAKMLSQQHQVKTAQDFVNLSDNLVQKKMGIVGLRLKKELMGFSCLTLESIAPKKQNICTSRSFGAMIKEYEPLSEAVATFASRCAFKLRKQGTCAKTITVFITTNRFSEKEPQYSPSCSFTLPTASNSSIDLVEYALKALQRIYRKGYQFKKAGVIVSEIVPKDQLQMNLFEQKNPQKHQAVMKSLDTLNHWYGREKVRLAATGTDRKWKLRQEFKTKCFTTNWQELFEIK
jgi:DNA polymerase V